MWPASVATLEIMIVRVRRCALCCKFWPASSVISSKCRLKPQICTRRCTSLKMLKNASAWYIDFHKPSFTHLLWSPGILESVEQRRSQEAVVTVNRRPGSFISPRLPHYPRDREDKIRFWWVRYLQCKTAISRPPGCYGIPFGSIL